MRERLEVVKRIGLILDEFGTLGVAGYGIEDLRVVDPALADRFEAWGRDGTDLLRSLLDMLNQEEEAVPDN